MWLLSPIQNCDWNSVTVQPTVAHYVPALLAALGDRGDGAVLHWRGEPVTGHEVARSVHDVSRRLRQLGVTPGATVGVLTTANSPLTLTIRYAAHLVGATVAHVRSTSPGRLDPLLPVATQAAMLREVGAGVLLVDAAHATAGHAIATELPGTTVVAVAECGAGVTAAFDGAPGFPDCAAVIYTSGSTGRPKGVRKSFQSWNRAVLAAYAARQAVEPVTFLAITPASQSIGLMLDVHLAQGGQVLLHEHFDPAEALHAITTARVTHTFMAVSQLYALTELAAHTGADVSSLRRLSYGGSPSSPKRLAEAVEVFGTALAQSYGTTESGRITELAWPDHGKPELLDTAGRPFPEVELDVRDPETGRSLPAGHTGEVVLRSPNVMTGYTGDPARTNDVLRAGWLHTGDLGNLDEQGYLRLVGRLGDVVKTGDTKVHPAAVEQVLMSRSDVVHAAVYGVRDADGLEHVHAAVVLRDGTPDVLDELRAHVGAALTPQHVPAHIIRLEEMPLTESGKADRRRLKSMDHDRESESTR